MTRPSPDIASPKKRSLRTGYTTGACAAAAARAAVRALLTGRTVREIGIDLPNGNPARFAVDPCELSSERARCTVVKDAGDDPDCTHGAQIAAEVVLRLEPGIEIHGGPGVAKVTKPGLGLEIGAPAINPVPRRNIADMVLAELQPSMYGGARVTISVPRGEDIARATLNARLGLIGGISILGTTGLVRPFSTAAWRASVASAVDVARAADLAHLVFTTGGRTERFAAALLPTLPEAAFIQVGDDIGLGLRRAARRGARQATVVAMVGKLVKMAAGALQTHVSRSQVDGAFLASLAVRSGASPQLAAAIESANTARHALQLADDAGLPGLCELVCRSAAEALKRAAGSLELRTALVGFDGALRATYPTPWEAP